MSKPKISVIIAVYNGEKDVATAIESVLTQTVPAHEIIIINDGSKDNTLQVLERYKGRVIVRTIPNGGVSNARNVGIGIATGDYVSFLDHDDIWFKHRLENISRLIIQYPEAHFFFSNYILRVHALKRRMLRHGNLVWHRKLGDQPFVIQEPLKWLFYENFVGTPSTAVVKREINGNRVYFRADCRLVEDLDFYLRIAAQTTFAYDPQISMYKREKETGMSFILIPLYEAQKKVLLYFREKEPALMKQSDLGVLFNDGLSILDYHIGNLYFEDGQRGRAFSMYWQALNESRSFHNFARFAKAVIKKTVRSILPIPKRDPSL